MPMQFRLAQFNPMTYDELSKPIAQAAEMHNQYEDALGTLATQASVWEKLANSAQDQNEYKTYKAYADKLQQASMSLMMQGLQPGTRRDLNALKAQYASDIQPIADAWTLREKMREQEYKEDVASNGRIRRERSAFNMGLSEFANGLPQNRAINLAEIEKVVGTRASILAKQVFNAEKKEKLNLAQYKISQQLGVSPEQFLAFCNDPNSREALPILQKLYNDAIEESGVTNWSNSEEVLGDVSNAITNGMLHSLGEVKSQYWTDEVAMANFKQKLANQAAANKAKKDKEAELDMWDPKLINRYSLRDRGDIEKGLQEYSKYVEIKDGKPVLTTEGKAALNQRFTSTNYFTSTGGNPTMVSSGRNPVNAEKSTSDFRKWYCKYVLGDESKINTSEDLSADAGQRMQNFIQTGYQNYNKDGIRNSMLEYRIDDSDGRQRAKELLVEQYSNSDDIAEFDIGQNGQALVATGDKLSKKDLLDKDTKVVGTYETYMGGIPVTLAIVHDKDGDIHYLRANFDNAAGNETLKSSYSALYNAPELEETSRALDIQLAQQVASGAITAEQVQAALMQLTAEGKYIPQGKRDTYERRAWRTIQDTRARSLSGIQANPQVYGASSTNTPYLSYFNQ